MSFMSLTLQSLVLFFKEECWERYSKCIGKNWFSYFLSMQCTNRGHLAMVVWFVHQEDRVARRHLLVY